MTDTPHNIDLERALFAAVISDNNVLDGLGRLQPEHFFDAEARELFAAAIDLRREGRAINTATLRGLTAADALGGASVAQRLKAVSFGDVTPKPQDMADAIIDLAHHLGCRVVAEGVESLESWDRLAELGCDLAQGDYVCPPMEAHELAAWFADRPAAVRG